MISYIPLEYVLELHDQLIDDYGGLKGVLNLGLLQSALEAPKAAFEGRYLHKTVYDKAAAYLFHISRNHPFVDGNKRTAGMVSILFLTANNVPFTIFEFDYQELILQTAQGRVSKKEIAKFFRHAHKT
jgi:death-on-curing protein